MPDAIELGDLRFLEAFDVKFFQQIVEDHAMQNIDGRPRQLTRAYPMHGRLITVAPGVGEFRRIHIPAFALRQRAHFANDAAAIVDHGAEDIERQRFNLL